MVRRRESPFTGLEGRRRDVFVSGTRDWIFPNAAGHTLMDGNSVSMYLLKVWLARSSLS